MGQCNSRAAPAGYRATVIAACMRGRLRSRGTQPSATEKSTAFNAVDSGCGSGPPVTVNKNEEKRDGWAHLAVFLHLTLPSPPPLHPEPAAKSEREEEREGERAP